MTDVTDITTRVARRFAERLDKDLRGAYRAGYNYLYVATPRHTGLDGDFSVRLLTMPAYTDDTIEHLAHTHDDYVWECFDLDISVGEFLRAKHASSTTHD